MHTTVETSLNEIDAIINKEILRLESTNPDIIAPEYIANMVDREIDPDDLSPRIKTILSLNEIRQRVRQALRNRHDPAAKAKDSVDSQDDMFSETLQSFYPVKRKGVSGETERVYIKRELMTSDDVLDCATRMQRAGETLIKHAEALKAWYKNHRAA